MVKTFLFNIFILTLDIQNYISSGILEFYAMDSLSEAEKQEVEAMLDRHEPLRKELERIQDTVIDYASLYAVEPPSNSLNKLLKTIDQLDETSGEFSNLSVGDVSSSKSNTVKRIRRLQYLAAAASILLFLSAGFNWMYHNELKSAYSELATFQAEQEIIVNNLNKVKSNFNAIAGELSVLQQPNSKVIKMSGVEAHAESFAYVYWNTESQEVYVKIGELPQAPTEKQYQLWALKDGKPIDAGIFNVENGLLKVKNIESADAFAVTLEPKGGSKSPTLDEMYVMGEVKVI